MRGLNTKALAIGIAAIAASGVSSGAGCSSTKPTEIVPGTLTQVQVPKDLAGIQVEVTANGAQKFCQGYQVASGFVELPSTLGVIQGAPNTTLRITIRGYDSATSNDLLDCNNLQVNQANVTPEQGPPPRVLRQAVLTYVDQHTLFLPMPLSYSCYDTDCSGQGSDSTCIAGACGSGDIAASSLADFTPSLIDGTQECFNPSACFAAALPAVVVDPVNCVYAIPPELQGQGSGLNVRITYTDDTWTTDPGTGIIAPVAGVPLEQEILSQDQGEGFYISASNTAQQFTLAQGLCGLVHNVTNPLTKPPPAGPAMFHTISDIEVATGCPSKLPLLPFCAGQQHGNVSSAVTPPVVACGAAIPLEPTPSAVYMAMDDSGSMHGTGSMDGAFGAQGYATAMNLSFAFPVFKHTYVAFRFLGHNPATGIGGECLSTATSTEYTSPAIDFGLSSAVQPGVAGLLLNPPTPSGETLQLPSALDLEVALRLDHGIYKHLLDFSQKLGADSGSQGPLNVTAAMLFVNRIPTVAPSVPTDAGSVYPGTAADCTPPLGTATAPSCNGDATCLALVAESKAAAQQNLSTYFVVLNDQARMPQPVLDFYNNVAAGAGAGVSVLDATSTQPSVVLQAFQKQLASVATCLYDLPEGVDDTATLTITVPAGTPLFNPTQFPAPITIASSSSCNLANASTAQGWNIDNGRIRICGDACNNVQGVLGAVALAALSQGSDGGTDGGFPTTADGGVPVIPDVPLDVTMPCVDAGSP